MKEIQLTHGRVALIDDVDYERVSKHKWSACLSGSKTVWYARATIKTERGRRAVGLHRFILNPPAELRVDHRNRNGLDNRRANLRLATQSQNQANCRRPSDNTSGYKGVRPENGKWRVQLRVNGKVVQGLGRYATAEEAARAYDRAAQEHFGEFARGNFDHDD